MTTDAVVIGNWVQGAIAVSQLLILYDRMKEKRKHRRVPEVVTRLSDKVDTALDDIDSLRSGLRQEMDMLRAQVAAIRSGQGQKTLPPARPCRYRILLVEDDPDDRYIFKKKLAPYFYITEAVSLSEALTAMERTPFDCVVLDLKLPNSKGVHTLTAFKQVHPGALCMILTGEQDPEVIAAARRQGVTGYLVKGTEGLDADYMAAMIQEMIARHEQETFQKES
jgi:CheY-like chemotaxis protein